MNQTAYLAALREALKRYPWAGNPEKLDRYMGRVEDGIASDKYRGGAGFEYDGPASVAAWRAIGGKGKPSLAALRALPVA